MAHIEMAFTNSSKTFDMKVGKERLQIPQAHQYPGSNIMDGGNDAFKHIITHLKRTGKAAQLLSIYKEIYESVGRNESTTIRNLSIEFDKILQFADQGDLMRAAIGDGAMAPATFKQNVIEGRTVNRLKTYSAAEYMEFVGFTQVAILLLPILSFIVLKFDKRSGGYVEDVLWDTLRKYPDFNTAAANKYIDRVSVEGGSDRKKNFTIGDKAMSVDIYMAKRMFTMLFSKVVTIDNMTASVSKNLVTRLHVILLDSTQSVGEATTLEDSSRYDSLCVTFEVHPGIIEEYHWLCEGEEILLDLEVTQEERERYYHYNDLFTKLDEISIAQLAVAGVALKHVINPKGILLLGKHVESNNKDLLLAPIRNVMAVVAMMLECRYNMPELLDMFTTSEERVTGSGILTPDTMAHLNHATLKPLFMDDNIIKQISAIGKGMSDIMLTSLESGAMVKKQLWKREYAELIVAADKITTI